MSIILIVILLVLLYGCGVKQQEWEKEEDLYRKEIKLLKEAFYIACKEKTEKEKTSINEVSDNYLRLVREKAKRENDNKFLY